MRAHIYWECGAATIGGALLNSSAPNTGDAAHMTGEWPPGGARRNYPRAPPLISRVRSSECGVRSSEFGVRSSEFGMPDHAVVPAENANRILSTIGISG